MTYDEFVGQVQHRAQLSDTGAAVAAIRATLETLGEHLFGGKAENLAAQLPREIGIHLSTVSLVGICNPGLETHKRSGEASLAAAGAGPGA